MTQIIKPKNTLKEKVGDGGFSKESIERAQKAIEDNDVDFKPIARELLDQLGTALSDAKSQKESGQSSFNTIIDPLTQLRAQGSLFHFASLTHISDVIVDFLDNEQSLDGDIFEILTAYKKAADALLALDIRNEKDPTCKTLIHELRQACTRCQKKRSE